MTNILIFDDNEGRIEDYRLQCKSRRINFRVRPIEPDIAPLETILEDVDLVIVSVERDRPSDWRLLKKVTEFKLTRRKHLPVLALCAVSRGAKGRRVAEDLGARSTFAW